MLRKMYMPPGFKSAKQQASFERARALHRLGGPLQEHCGAGRPGGPLCRRVPVEGLGRCQQHLGPTRSAIFRERQREAFERGEISPEAWARIEARRAVNAQRIAWRRDPWTPGQTLDLGAEEGALREALAAFGIGWASLSPATLDAARWRYRRAYIDRCRPDDWQGFVLGKLRERIDAEGPPPAWHVPGSAATAPGAPAFRCEPLSPNSKRRRLDTPKRRSTSETKNSRPDLVSKRVQRPISSDPDTVSRLEQICFEHWSGLRPIAEGLGIAFDDREALLRLTRAFAETSLVGDHLGWVAALAAFKAD